MIQVRGGFDRYDIDTTGIGGKWGYEPSANGVELVFDAAILGGNETAPKLGTLHLRLSVHQVQQLIAAGSAALTAHDSLKASAPLLHGDVRPEQEMEMMVDSIDRSDA